MCSLLEILSWFSIAIFVVVLYLGIPTWRSSLMKMSFNLSSPHHYWHCRNTSWTSSFQSASPLCPLHPNFVPNHPTKLGCRETSDSPVAISAVFNTYPYLIFFLGSMTPHFLGFLVILLAAPVQPSLLVPTLLTNYRLEALSFSSILCWLFNPVVFSALSVQISKFKSFPPTSFSTPEKVKWF